MNRAGTRLGAPDVFFFGSLLGDTGESVTPTRVDARDEVRVLRRFGTAAPVTSPLDIDRDGKVNASDVLALRRNMNAALVPPVIPIPVAALSSVDDTAFVPASVRTGSRRRAYEDLFGKVPMLG